MSQEKAAETIAAPQCHSLLAGSILVIPDVHGRVFWKGAVEQYSDCRDIVFLGDYHDPYPRERIPIQDSLENFREIIKFARAHSNVTLLLGNHDLHYLCDFGETCRMDFNNYEQIKALILDNIDLFKIIHHIDINGQRVVFTHAPILVEWLHHLDAPGDITQLGLLLNQLPKQAADKPDTLLQWFNFVSSYRGGCDRFGSPVWADMREAKGYLIQTADYSIFGHTQLTEAVITRTWANLDCRRAFLVAPDLTITPVDV